jgi:hypothetical protein
MDRGGGVPVAGEERFVVTMFLATGLTARDRAGEAQIARRVVWRGARLAPMRGLVGLMILGLGCGAVLGQPAPEPRKPDVQLAPAMIDRSPFGGTEVHRQMRQAVPNAPSTAVTVPRLPALLPSNPPALPEAASPARPLTHDALQRALQEKARAVKGAAEAASRAEAEKAGERKALDQGAKPGDPKPEEKAAAAVAAVAPSGDDAKTPGPSDPALPAPPSAMFNGSFTQSVLIEVPAFRGYEPKLRLVYDSNHGLRAGGLNAGWVGHGWHLEGVSEIVRIAPRRGTPRFDASDTWMIDGEEMVACGPGVESPSCAQGGTHVTRVESYRRHVYDGGANQWIVTDRDGTRSVYVAIGGFAHAASPSANHTYFYRYVLHKRYDPNGNELTYWWACDVLPTCVPQAIAYGATTILFHSETRPDPTEMAVGGALMRSTARLKTVDIVSYGHRARAYKLSYDQSPATGVSRLVSVQQYGKDATLDAASTITGGTALPPHTFQYQGNAVNLSVEAQSIPVPAVPGPFVGGSGGGYTHNYALEANNDQKTDLVMEVFYPPG